MNYFSILAHLGTIIAAIKEIEGVAQTAIKQKRFPTVQEGEGLISAIESLVAAGIIDIPDKTDAEIKQALDAIKASL